jgi:hypothetical protein
VFGGKWFASTKFKAATDFTRIATGGTWKNKFRIKEHERRCKRPALSRTRSRSSGGVRGGRARHRRGGSPRRRRTPRGVREGNRFDLAQADVAQGEDAERFEQCAGESCDFSRRLECKKVGHQHRTNPPLFCGGLNEDKAARSSQDRHSTHNRSRPATGCVVRYPYLVRIKLRVARNRSQMRITSCYPTSGERFY